MLAASDRAPYKMEPIPSHRAKEIFQEYLDRQAEERNKTRLEMAQRIRTWYSDLESEVSEHFDKALQQSAKRARLEVSPTTLVSDTSADSNDRSWTSSPMVPPRSHPLSVPPHPAPLPSLFCPPPPDHPIPSMIYPEYYHYTNEVDPLVTDDDDYSSDATSLGDDGTASVSIHAPHDLCPTAHAAVNCYDSAELYRLEYESQFPDYPPLSAASDLVCDLHCYDGSMFTEGYYPPYSITGTATHCDLPQLTHSFGYTLHTSPATTCDGSRDDDDDIENIHLDWTEEERNELQEIMV